MSSPEIERLVTAALQADAEDAMNRTNTTEPLQSLVGARGRDTRKRGRLLAVGALTAAAAAVAVLVSWPGGDDRTAPPVGPPTKTERVTEAEQVAGDFIEALAAFDRGRAATYVAPGAGLTMGNVNVMRSGNGKDAWTLRNRWDEATGWSVTQLEGCHQTGVRRTEAHVRCLFTAHQLGSVQLDRGPFGDNVLTVTVRSGAIVDADLSTAHTTNGFAETIWNPFWAWMGKAHPNDEPLMAGWEKPDASPARVNGSLRLWHQRVQEYVEAVQAGETQ